MVHHRMATRTGAHKFIGAFVLRHYIQLTHKRKFERPQQMLEWCDAQHELKCRSSGKGRLFFTARPRTTHMLSDDVCQFGQDANNLKCAYVRYPQKQNDA